MVSDAQVRTITLFFLFSLMDEKLAIEAASKTIAQVKSNKSFKSKKSAKQGIVESDSESNVDQLGGDHFQLEIIPILKKGFDYYRKYISRSQISSTPTTAWKLPESTSLEAWRLFHSEVSEAELIAVTLSKILRFHDESISRGLGVSLGTIRYRTSKGTRLLGQSLQRATSKKRA